MGVNIGELLSKKEISLEDLKNKTIAIDASLILYQFLSSIRQGDGSPLTDSKNRVTSHLVGLSTRIPNLMSKGLKLVFVFDGKPPKLKFKEHEKREERKALAEEKVKIAKEKEDVDEMYKYSRQVSRLDSEMVDEAKKLIGSLGIPIIQAPCEAEAQAAFMCKNNDVFAVGSNDVDSLLFGAKRLIQNLTLAQRKRLASGAYVPVVPNLIELKDVLKELKIDQDQLIILSILVGTDFNVGGVKGIGPKKALKIVQSDKKFDLIFKELSPDLNWQEVFETFKKMPIKKDYSLEWKEIDPERFKKILVDNHDFSEERVDKILKNLNQSKEKSQENLKKWF